MRVRGRSIAVDQRENFYVLFAEESHLVTKYDSTGKVLAQFGQPVEQDREKFGRNVGYLVYDDLSGKLILSFMCAPIVKVFTTNGDQVRETKLSRRSFRRSKARNVPLGQSAGGSSLTFTVQALVWWIVRSGLCSHAGQRVTPLFTVAT
jgi:hypothetical protein